MTTRLAIASLALAAASLAAQQPDKFARPAAKHAFEIEKNVMVPMRDGVRLATDVYHPKDLQGKLPVIVLRTPYNKDTYRGSTGPAEFFAGQGYIVVSQDVRGKYHSEGDYQVQSHDRIDGYDTIDWAAKQPWSNGKVGTYGCSYLGEVQILEAAARHPNHLAAIPQAAAGGLGSAGGYWASFGTYESGVFSLSSAFGWFLGAGAKDKNARTPQNVDFPAMLKSLPEVDMVKRVNGPRSDFEDELTHRPGDPYWMRQGYATDTTRFDVPAIHVNSWLDYGAEQVLYLFNLFRRNAVSARARDNQFVIISPTTHCGSESAGEHTVVGQRDFGDARLDYYRIYRDWFDYWLKGDRAAITRMPKVQYYLMGKNEWRSAPSWPVPGMTPVAYYLTSEKGATTAAGDGALTRARPARHGLDTVTYDPADPFPSRGGTICCTGNPKDQPGVFDQSDLGSRRDLLVYSTPVLKEGLTIVGPVRVRLYFSSDAKDTDIAAKLLDVDENGKAWNVVNGILRVRYRDGITRSLLMEPGKIYPVEVNVKSIAYQFKPGHRIQLFLSNSDFPAYERNTNTGGHIFDETSFVKAKSSLHFGAQYPSALILPVVAK